MLTLFSIAWLYMKENEHERKRTWKKTNIKENEHERKRTWKKTNTLLRTIYQWKWWTLWLVTVVIFKILYWLEAKHSGKTRKFHAECKSNVHLLENLWRTLHCCLFNCCDSPRTTQYGCRTCIFGAILSESSWGELLQNLLGRSNKIC